MKKCPVCGKEWSDATKFCGSCGAKLEDGNIVVPDIVPDDGKQEQRKKTEPVKPSVKKTIEPVRPKTRETTENKKIAEEKAEEKEEEKNTAERKKAEYNKSDAVLPVKRRKKGWKIATALGLTAIVAAGAVVFYAKSGESIKHPFVELYGDSYEILTKEKLGHTITITDNGLDWLGDAVMQLSPDRKYLYYMENYDISTGTSRLYRCEYQKLSKKEEKNEKYKTKVAANVRVFYPLEDGKLLYIDKDSELFCYDGEVSVKIADSLQGYNQLKDGTGLVYTKGSADEGFDVCGVSYDNPTEEIFLADGMTDVMLADDQEHILCRRYKDSYDESDQLVFMACFGKEAEELGKPVTSMYAWENGAVYYFASGESRESKLEDLVTDSSGNTERWQEMQEEWDLGAYQSLYEYKNGEITKLTDKNFGNEGFYNGNCVLYADWGKLQKIDLADVPEDEDLSEIIGPKMQEQCIYVKATSRKEAVHVTEELEKKIEEAFDEDKNFWIYANETDLFLESGSDFWHATIKNDEVSDLEEMPEGYVKSVTPTEIYYTSNFYTEGDNAYYDVNVIENGKSRCLAKEVLEDYVKIYEDGTVMAYTDRNSDGEYELSIFDKKGNKTKIADGVTKAIRKEDGDILYDRRHDLMLYQKEESERIGIGIIDFWYADEMETEQDFRLDW